jgi:excisionase family DNA binding protein
MKPEEVADLLRVSLKTIRRWANNPRTRMPAVHIQGTLRFNRLSLERWLQAEESRGRRSRKQMLSVVKSAPSDAPDGRCAEPCAEGPR